MEDVEDVPEFSDNGRSNHEGEGSGLQDIKTELTDGLGTLAEDKARDVLTREVVRDVTIVGGSVLLGLGLLHAASYVGDLRSNAPADSPSTGSSSTQNDTA